MLVRRYRKRANLLAHTRGGVPTARCHGDRRSCRDPLLVADLMRRYTEQDLERYEDLVAEARDRIMRQQALIDQLTDLDGFEPACATLDSLMETALLYEEERVRILEALTK